MVNFPLLCLISGGLKHDYHVMTVSTRIAELLPAIETSHFDGPGHCIQLRGPNSVCQSPIWLSNVAGMFGGTLDPLQKMKNLSW